MSANTTIPAVQNKLLELFKAATSSEVTEVWPKRTNEDHQIEENVYLGEVRGRREFRTIPAGTANAREETYSIEVELEVYRAGTDLEGTEARMWELAQALESAVASRPNLEGLVDRALGEEFQQLTEALTDGILAKYTFGVGITARI